MLINIMKQVCHLVGMPTYCMMTNLYIVVQYDCLVSYNPVFIEFDWITQSDLYCKLSPIHLVLFPWLIPSTHGKRTLGHDGVFLHVLGHKKMLHWLFLWRGTKKSEGNKHFVTSSSSLGDRQATLIEPVSLYTDLWHSFTLLPLSLSKVIWTDAMINTWQI